MSSTRIKRAKAPPRRPVRAPRKRRRVQTSRLDAIINALPVRPATLQRIANWTIGLSLFAVAGLAAHATGVTAKVQEEWAQAVGRAGFQVRKVEVVGADRIDRLKVYDIALAQKDRSMAAVDLEGVRHDLMQYGWIKDARVSRRLPDTLVVDIVERSPAAIWQNAGRLSLIDEKGVVLEPVSVATMPDLPLVIGPSANRRAQDLDRLLAEASSLKELLAGATWVGNRRWDLRFRSGETLSLPEGETEAKRALAKFAHMDGANRLLGRGILRFDMRDPSRFVLRLPHEGQVAPAKLDAARAAADAVAASTANEG
ncbi:MULTISPECIES: cell division protein FtsQ/DivIB [Sphingopyxis]|uniref:Cell division protein FtsQ n=1 Tax=Sphingopyxis granuli TaxID=267128 RepID=A0AA86GJC9_9SPHN|nr:MULTISPECIES: cell division protein FtsQ/DivIB [Sphingopyxis]AMG73874.1 Cell division protein FtsQ [Sphingopyxis granuli]AVA13155.1 cell division protein FtsQ [Sphingopyxis sp. MG]ODU27675.1 MAG: cell division protein FtsQ [Sphingopyxis sp. SCN 67-31]QUM71870.1 FtsQ-type POTRA domain-containing protein [Sphingopyxis granuli]UNK80900.1 FtsQ-type POTRA domain-containing protein [Sphingopyxis granuli]